MVYGKINETGGITYATFRNGALVVGNQLVWCSDSDYSVYGYYPVKNIEEDGDPVVVNGELLNYIGAPTPKSEEDLLKEYAENKLGDTTDLIKAIERIIASLGVTEEDKAMALERIQLRDSLGKLILTETGDGSAMNPYNWVSGKAVIKDSYYRTPSNYIWLAIKDGVPESETDEEYFEVIGL